MQDRSSRLLHFYSKNISVIVLIKMELTMLEDRTVIVRMMM